MGFGFRTSDGQSGCAALNTRPEKLDGSFSEHGKGSPDFILSTLYWCDCSPFCLRIAKADSENSQNIQNMHGTRKQKGSPYRVPFQVPNSRVLDIPSAGNSLQNEGPTVNP